MAPCSGGSGSERAVFLWFCLAVLVACLPCKIVYAPWRCHLIWITTTFFTAVLPFTRYASFILHATPLPAFPTNSSLRSEYRYRSSGRVSSIGHSSHDSLFTSFLPSGALQWWLWVGASCLPLALPCCFCCLLALSDCIRAMALPPALDYHYVLHGSAALHQVRFIFDCRPRLTCRSQHTQACAARSSLTEAVCESAPRS